MVGTVGVFRNQGRPAGQVPRLRWENRRAFGPHKPHQQVKVRTRRVRTTKQQGPFRLTEEA